MNEKGGGASNSSFGFSRWEVFEPLRRHVSFIVVFTLSATLSALLITYIYSDKYEAQITMVLKPQDVTRLREHDTLALGAPLPQAEYKIVGQTLEDLVKSVPLLTEVVKQLHLDAPESRIYTGPFYYRWYKEAKDQLQDYGADTWSVLKYGRVIEKDPVLHAVETLHNNIKIDNSDSNVFVLKVRDKHPERVDAVATTLAHDLIALLQKNEQSTAAVRIAELRDRLAHKYEAIERDSEQINRLLISSQVGSIAEQIDKLTGEYAEVQTALVTTESDARQQQATIDALTAKLAQGGAYAAGAQRLHADDFNKMASDRLAAEITLAGLKHKNAALRASLNGLSERLKQLASAQVQYDLLDQNRQRTQRDYTLINDALQEKLLAEGNSVTSIITAGPAVASSQPVAPIKIYHVGLAFALGLLIAIGVAFVFGYFDIRFFMSSAPGHEEPRREPDVASPPAAEPLTTAD